MVGGHDLLVMRVRPSSVQLLVRLADRLSHVLLRRELLALRCNGLGATHLVEHLVVREMQVCHAHVLSIVECTLALRWSTTILFLHMLLNHHHLLGQIVAVSLLHFAS